MAAPLPERVSFPAEEEKVLELWKRLDAFKKSLELTEGKPEVRRMEMLEMAASQRLANFLGSSANGFDMCGAGVLAICGVSLPIAPLIRAGDVTRGGGPRSG
jgi:hypothetical protein